MSDSFTDFLKRGIGPRVGMWRIPFTTESYEHQSPPLSSKKLLNFYVEQEPSDARAVLALMSTPGLDEWPNVFGAGPVLAANSDQSGVVYFVSGTHFYRLTAPYPALTFVIEDLGSVGASAEVDYAANMMIPTIAVGVNAAVVCVPPNAFTCSHTGPLNQIGGTFPGGISVTYIDGYFVFTASPAGTSQFFCSLLLDPTMYDALDFAYADGVPNILRRAFTLRGELWFGGDKGWEIWYDAGLTSFPFLRRIGGQIRRGIINIRTAALCDESIFWVSDGGIVYRAGGPNEGYFAVRVSTHAVEAAMRVLTANSVQCSFSYTQDGHTFYCVTFGTRTFCYDCATQKWADRSSSADGSTAWFPSCAVQVGNAVMFGDSRSGKTFLADPAVPSEDGINIMRQVVLPPVWTGTDRGFCNRVEIEMEVGGSLSPGNVLLDWSDDGGTTWRTPARVMKSGTITGTRKRVYTTRLGSFRQRVFRITVMGHATFYAFDADITNLLAGG